MRRAALGLAPITLLLAACSGETGEDVYQGYVEGKYVLVAAESAGRLDARPVRRGETVETGAALFTLDTRVETAALAEAEARLAQGQAQLADLRSGKRPEEIRVLDAELAEAEASERAAGQTYRRTQALTARAVSARAELDQAQASLDAARARTAAARQNRLVATLEARPETIAAAEANVGALGAAVETARTALARRSAAAVAAGRIEETYFEPGEFVAAGQPVVSLLPKGAAIARFYVPEPVRARFAPGSRVALACDGCAAGLSATVESVATDAEYTPPVIYSEASRAKLVFRVEARLDGAAATLAPGQPVDVRPLEGSGT
ncbi:HlyD family secretion protein [Prosthecomicrobium pneumaticum]|uniref:HlyD family secretion protein n=1 Tax=Prosthecomicrobium pneumaticum TaxID=81895 RepID=A0A7W9FK69_9HYPH|nr:HlyD family efflux transporter periplasmic adaptor subunit [Prosthecomicrobium pneumaticum]MBB5752336.1 HlyD family secretion protein [Prosthecomicrobium pneumaticum]